MNKKNLAIGIIGVLLFAELNIDFAIGFGDTGLVGLFSILVFLLSGIGLLVALAKKNKEKAVQRGTILVSLILGTLLGGTVTSWQFEKAQAYVETLASELNEIKELNGTYPESLSELESFDGTGEVQIGIFRKRPVYLSLNEEYDRYQIWFPYIAFMVAEYNLITGEWTIDD